MRKAAGALCSAIIIALSACSGAGQTAGGKDTGTMTDNVYDAGTDNVKPLGRTYYDGDYLWCAFSGSGAEFTVTGKSCTVTIKADRAVTVPNNEGNHARIGIYLDGERVIDDMINEREKTYTVFEGGEPREAVVSVVKLSETAMSCFAIGDINVESGEIKPAPEKELFIEFVGDSITCGYGVDDENENHHFLTSTEDVTKAYAYRTAAALNADYSMVSISGYGIISGYTDSGKKKITDQTISRYYEKLGFSYGGSNDFVPQDIRWDFSARQPDIVVINLGTNDDSYCRDDADKQAEYKAGYIEFLKTVRKNNPNAKIVCALGIMGDRLFPTVEKAAAEYTAETGDENIFTVHLTPQTAADGFVADYHPRSATHAKAAEKMTSKIKEIIG